MSISNYSELQTAIGAWTHRTDLAPVIPDFIKLAEARLQLDLNARQLYSLATLSTVSGTNTVSLPADFNGARSVSLASGQDMIVLDAMTVDMLRARWGSYSAGYPRNYSVRGTDILLGPTPDDAYSIVVEYTAKIQALSVSNTTNSILTDYPDAYLHCSLIFAGQYLRDPDFVQGFEALYAADVARINAQNWGQTSPMTIKAG